MPYIRTRTNANVNKEQEIIIKSRFGEAISSLGKTEQWLMVDIESNCNMYFHGDSNSMIAYIEIHLYGSTSIDAYDKMTGIVTNIISEVLNIEKSNIYVSYYPTDTWGWNGRNF